MMSKAKQIDRELVKQAFIANGFAEDSADLIADHWQDQRWGTNYLTRYVNRTFDADFRAKRAAPAKSKATISNALRKQIFERDAYRCQHCGDWHDLTVDHIHPEALGGTLEPENLQTLCRKCNSRKGIRT